MIVYWFNNPNWFPKWWFWFWLFLVVFFWIISYIKSFYPEVISIVFYFFLKWGRLVSTQVRCMSLQPHSGGEEQTCCEECHLGPWLQSWPCGGWGQLQDVGKDVNYPWDCNSGHLRPPSTLKLDSTIRRAPSGLTPGLWNKSEQQRQVYTWPSTNYHACKERRLMGPDHHIYPPSYLLRRRQWLKIMDSWRIKKII